MYVCVLFQTKSIFSSYSIGVMKVCYCFIFSVLLFFGCSKDEEEVSVQTEVLPLTELEKVYEDFVYFDYWRRDGEEHSMVAWANSYAIRLTKEKDTYIINSVNFYKEREEMGYTLENCKKLNERTYRHELEGSTHTYYFYEDSLVTKFRNHPDSELVITSFYNR